MFLVRCLYIQWNPLNTSTVNKSFMCPNCLNQNYACKLLGSEFSIEKTFVRKSGLRLINPVVIMIVGDAQLNIVLYVRINGNCELWKSNTVVQLFFDKPNVE